MYKIVELTCDTPYLPGQWSGRMADGRPVYIRNNTYEAEVRIGVRDGDADSAVSGDRIYRGLAVEVDAIAVSVICANAGIELATPKVEGMA